MKAQVIGYGLPKKKIARPEPDYPGTGYLLHSYSMSKSLDPLYIVNYHIKWVETSWTYFRNASDNG